MNENGVISVSQGQICLDYRQAAKALGISQRTLSDLVKDGEIPVVRIRGRVLFHYSTLDEWAKAQSGSVVTGTSAA